MKTDPRSGKMWPVVQYTAGRIIKL